MTIQFKKHWTDADFNNIQEAIENYFSFTPISSSHFNQPAAKKSFEAIDNILGLAFTSTGMCASYSICNIEAKYNKDFVFQYFAIGNDGEFYAVCWDENENEITTSIRPFTCKEDVLKCCTVKENVVSLPPQQLSRDLYNDVKQSLNLIGGTWKGGKVQGFEFKENPAALLEQIANGEKRNLKKEFQFFGTPDKLADHLVQLAEIKKGDTILEPQAGQGAIISAIHRADGTTQLVDYCELMEVNKAIIEKKIDNKLLKAQWIADDFLTITGKYQWDRIIANPPFNKNQDIDHIYKMYECCKEGGRIVTIASKHWQRSANKKEMAFKNWLDEVNAKIIEVEAGEFKESGTGIATCIIIIDK